MIYEAIPILPKGEIFKIMSSATSTVDEKVLHLYSAAYNFDIKDAAQLLLDVLKSDETELKNNVTEVIEAFMQSRNTSYMAKEFIRVLDSSRGEINKAQDVIEAIQEFEIIFPTVE